MGEVAEMFDVNQSLIRHWESQFRELKPKRNKKGNRLFTPKDVDYIKLIYHLVKERGMTLDGARKALKQHHEDGGVRREAELLERLQRIRAMLVEVREQLKIEDDEIDMDSPTAVVRGAEPASVERTSVAPHGDPAEQPSQHPPKKETANRRRHHAEEKDRELFAFYEQSLF